MTTNNKFSRPFSTVMTVPDPDNMSVASHAEQSGTFQWRTDTHNYPNFEVRFIGPNPSNGEDDLILPGSDTEPVIIRLNTVDDYRYGIRHYGKDGDFKDTGPFLLRVNPCNGCPPLG